MSENEQYSNTVRKTNIKLSSFIMDKFYKPKAGDDKEVVDHLLMNYLISLLGTVFSTPE